MKDLKHASARGVAWNLVQNVVSRTLSLVVVAILSRILDKHAFGSVALALTITSFCELIANQGYGEFVTQTPDPSPEDLDTAFWFNVTVGALLTGIVALCATPLANAFDEPEVAPVIRWLSVAVFLRALVPVPYGLLVRKLAFRSLSARMITGAIAGGTAGVIAAYSGLGVYSLVLQFVVGDAVATITMWHAVDWRPGRRISLASLKRLSAFGTPIMGAAMLSFASRRLDPLIVGAVLGISILGLYTIAQRVYQILLQVINKSTTDVTFGALSRLSDSADRRHRAFCGVIELTAVLCFPLYVGLAIVAEPLTVSLFGAKWIDSAPVMVLFALTGVPYSLSLVHLAAFKSTARTRAIFVINLTALLIYLPLVLVLVHYGPRAAAAASLISCTVIVPIEIALLRAALDLRVIDYLKALIGGAVATLAMAAAALGLLEITPTLRPLVRLVTIAGAGGAVYVVSLRVLAPATFARVRSLALSTFRKQKAS